MKYAKELKQFIGDYVEYNEHYGGGYIWGKQIKKEGLELIAQVEESDDPEFQPENPIVSVRGWGAIQHLFKTKKDQEEFQDELGKFIQDAINEKLKTL